MFEKYFLIYYDNLPKTLAKLGIKLEEYNKMENKPKIYPETLSFSTRCNKKQLVSLISKINEVTEGIKVQQVIKIDRYLAFRYGKFVPFYLIENRLTELLA